MKFWQAALLSLLLAMCIGVLLRIYAPFVSSGVCFGIAFVITAACYASIKKEKVVEPPEEVEEVEEKKDEEKKDE